MSPIYQGSAYEWIFFSSNRFGKQMQISDKLIPMENAGQQWLLNRFCIKCREPKVGRRSVFCSVLSPMEGRTGRRYWIQPLIFCCLLMTEMLLDHISLWCLIAWLSLRLIFIQSNFLYFRLFWVWAGHHRSWFKSLQNMSGVKDQDHMWISI